jgi:hypothetical protein
MCGTQNGTEVVFSECFGFSCHFSFHRLLHTRPLPGLVKKVRSGYDTKWTRSHPAPTTHTK